MKFQSSDFHGIVMRGEKPFWDYVAERANEVLEKNLKAEIKNEVDSVHNDNSGNSARED